MKPYDMTSEDAQRMKHPCFGVSFKIWAAGKRRGHWCLLPFIGTRPKYLSQRNGMKRAHRIREHEYEFRAYSFAWGPVEMSVYTPFAISVRDHLAYRVKRLARDIMRYEQVIETTKRRNKAAKRHLSELMYAIERTENRAND